jgi:site-specific recombinase XerD
LTALLKPAAAARKAATKATAVPAQGPSAAGAVPGPVTMASLYAQWQHAYRGRRAAKTLSGPQGLIDQLERFRPGLTPLDFVPDASGRCEVLQDFCVYCMEQAKGRTGDVGLFNNTISSYLKRLRKLLKFGRYEHEWIEDEYSEEVDREPLTFAEVLQLAQHPVAEWREGGNKHSSRAGIRDVFVFICLTGPRYGSLLEVGPDAVVFDHLAGAEIPVLEYYTYKNRRNKEKVRVPLDELAYSIWQRYDGKLPVPSLGKFNEAIKQLCREAGLTRTVKVLRGSGAKRLEERQPLWQTVSAHIGRYTFITTQHEGGADLVSIQDTVGHADINTTRKYTKSREKDRLTTTRGAFTTLRNRQP